MIKEGYISLQCLLLGLGVISYFIIGCTGYYALFDNWVTEVIIFSVIFFVVINIVIYIVYRNEEWQIAVHSGFIGIVMGIAVIICILCISSYKPFGYYLFILSFFHISEYLATAVTNPQNLSLDSFLLNHSVAYWVAALASWAEFFTERWFVPQWKELWYISVVGVSACVLGEVLRKLAMVTASRNFNHVVQVEKQENHQLVTWGVYKYSRHPSYVGWFWWSIGTQIILINPICLVAYALASWNFFNTRIKFEEITLIKFFGKQYLDYKKRVGSGLPFISGYNIKENT